MNRPTELFDNRIADWLEGGPDAAPGQIMVTLAAALPAIPQRRPSRLVWWGRVRLGRLAANAAVVVLVVAGTVLALSTWRSSTGPPPSPTSPPPPSPPSSIGFVELSPFTSPFYGYTLDVPVGWGIHSATEALVPFGIPYVDTAEVDTVTAPITGPIPNGKVIGAMTQVPETETLEAWTAQVADGQCGSPSAVEPIALGGEPGLLSTFTRCHGYFHQWATAIRGGVGVHVLWMDFNGTEAADRAIFERILASFQFPPASPTAPPATPASTP